MLLNAAPRAVLWHLGLTMPSIDDYLSVMLPLVVCVSPDRSVRERLAAQLTGQVEGGVVMVAPDLEALRAVLWPTVETSVASTTAPPGEPVADELVVDERGRRVLVRGRPVALTRIECALVGHLAGPPGRVWTYERLFTTVWGGTYLGDNAILHSAVKRLRRKLREVDPTVELETVRGVGYRLVIG
jgi:two-component system, OmpR family, response regulator MtrA